MVEINYHDDRRSEMFYYLDDYTVVRETEKAYLVRDHNGAQEWLPKSHTTIGEPPLLGFEVVLYVQPWLAKAKRLDWKQHFIDAI